LTGAIRSAAISWPRVDLIECERVDPLSGPTRSFDFSLLPAFGCSDNLPAGE
jgi:hypothetical protein